MFSTNCTIALLIRSDSLMWYRSQIVVISSFSDKGILKQVWYWCLIIWCSFHQFEYGESVCSLFRIFFSVLIHELQDFPSNPIEVWGLVPLVSSSFELLLISSLCRSIYRTREGYPLWKPQEQYQVSLSRGLRSVLKGLFLRECSLDILNPVKGTASPFLESSDSRDICNQRNLLNQYYHVWNSGGEGGNPISSSHTRLGFQI